MLEWLVSALVIVIGVAYFWMHNRFKFWKKRGISSLTPSFPWGNFGLAVASKESMGMLVARIYSACKGSGPIAGCYLFGIPGIVTIDPETIKNVIVRDFQYFQDRGIFYNEKDDPLSAHLFAIEGEKWKTLRAKISPTFTSGKMKVMFRTMVESANELRDYMSDAVANDSVFEFKDILARFTTDIIGSCALGIQCNSLKDPKAEFREIGKKIIAPSIVQNLKGGFAMSFRSLGLFLRLKISNPEVANFFTRTVSDTIKYRENNNVSRNDFLQLLMQQRNMDGNDCKTNLEMSGLSVNEIAAQAFIFFLAGFETSSSTMSFCLYELALNPEIQKKVRDHINEVLAKHGGELTYDALIEMEYLDMTINELPKTKSPKDT